MNTPDSVNCTICVKPATHKLVHAAPFQPASDKALAYCCEEHQKTVLMLHGRNDPDVMLVRLEPEQE